MGFSRSADHGPCRRCRCCCRSPCAGLPTGRQEVAADPKALLSCMHLHLTCSRQSSVYCARPVLVHLSTQPPLRLHINGRSALLMRQQWLDEACSGKSRANKLLHAGAAWCLHWTRAAFSAHCALLHLHSAAAGWRGITQRPRLLSRCDDHAAPENRLCLAEGGRFIVFCAMKALAGFRLMSA